MKSRLPELEAPAQPVAPSHGSDSASRRNMAQAFWRHRWWIVLATIAGVCGSYIYLKKQVRVFSAYSRIYIQENTPSVLGASGIDAQTGIATQCEIIRSTPLLTEVSELPEVKSLQIIKTSPNPLVTIRRGLLVIPAAAPDLVTITYEAINPMEAAQMANAIVDTYVRFTEKQKKNNAADALRLLTREKEKKELELQQEEKALHDFRLKQLNHGSIPSADKGGQPDQERARLADLYTNASVELIHATATYDAVHLLDASPQRRARLLVMAKIDKAHDDKRISTEPDSRPMREQEDVRLVQTSNRLRDEVDQQERKVMKLKLDHTSEHLDVKEAEADLQLLRRQLDDNEKRIAAEKAREAELERQEAETARLEAAKRDQALQEKEDDQLIERYVTYVDNHYQDAIRTKEYLEHAHLEKTQAAIESDLTAFDFDNMERDHKRTLDACNLLAESIQKINVNEDTRGQVNVEILEVARPNYIAVRPDKPRVLGLGMIIGLALGCGVAFGLDKLDERFRSAEEVMEALDVPVLGIIPHIVEHETIQERGRQVVLKPMSDVAESYRTIRTAIYFAIRNEGAKRLLVTSPAPGDGKTTTTTNIAIAMAQAGRKVLLLDADFRKPTIHKIFQISPAVGVSSIMLGEVSREKAIQPSGILNLDLLPCGPLPSNPAEILNGQAFLDLLEGLDRLYDHIIIDSPPVVPVTDARILGALCDDTILVLRAEKSTRRLSEHACESLLSVGTRILGVVVNDVPRRRDGYGYYYGYGGGYRYYHYGYGQQGNGNQLRQLENANADGGPDSGTDSNAPKLRLKA